MSSSIGQPSRGPTTVADRLWVLFVSDAEEPLRAVERILLDRRMSTRRVRNCSEAIAVLQDSNPPALVMTDTCLPDGGWADVLEATCDCPQCPPLIVVSRLSDIGLYLDVMESGAYDFLVPPLTWFTWLAAHSGKAHITAMIRTVRYNSNGLS
jgi:DNA-binding NtrC family response regulator